MDKDKQQGLTLPELMTVLTVVSILTVYAVPAFNQPIEKQRILNATEAISLDLRWARGEAIKRNTEVTVSFTDGPAETWQYLITPATKTVSSAELKEFAGVALSPSTTFTADRVKFNPIRGTANAGRINLSSSNYAMEVRVSLIGRIRICGNIPGYQACP